MAGDLFSGLGELPQYLAQVHERVKDISFQSKTRFSHDQGRAIEEMRSTLADVIAKLPENLRSAPQVKKLEEIISTFIASSSTTKGSPLAGLRPATVRRGPAARTRS